MFNDKRFSKTKTGTAKWTEELNYLNLLLPVNPLTAKQVVEQLDRKSHPKLCEYVR